MLLFLFLSSVSCGLIEITKAQYNRCQQPSYNFYQGSPRQSPSLPRYPKSSLCFQTNPDRPGAAGAPPLFYDFPPLSYNCPHGQDCSTPCGCQQNQRGCPCGYQSSCGCPQTQCGCQPNCLYAPYFNNPSDSYPSTQCCKRIPPCSIKPLRESPPPEPAPLLPVTPLSTTFVPAQNVAPKAYFLPQASQELVVSIMPEDDSPVVCLGGARRPIVPPPPSSCILPGILDDMASLIPANDCPCCCGCCGDSSLCAKRSVCSPLLFNQGYELDFMDNEWIDAL